ncbi:PREDICTED: uncharacterized protein LOC106329494 isoform X2 [Brassica oleracea var. oleracea]|uniref:uncharacterized protein LOC106329494 isoform X2 n=1 Tax=Brassica oleracea var. oleracea TaxID=109376 RepID=UPI0006A6C415|nr:PREDICTED: uncharacterized protein LOC106329494 isoform X2 [Brassica oleracea var. oleracea]
MATEKPITTETVALTEKKMDMSLDAIIKMSKSNTNVNKGKKLRASNKKEKFNGAAKNSTVKAQRYMDSRSDVRQGAFAKRRSNFQGNHFPVTTAVARNVASGAPIRGRPINAGRMANTNQSRSRLLDNSLINLLNNMGSLYAILLSLRFITPPAQYGSAPRGFVAKQQWEKIEQKQANGGGQRQGPQTLDSRFANMKEERMRRFAEKGSNVGNNGVGLQYQQQQQQRPWGRRAARFPN